MFAALNLLTSRRLEQCLAKFMSQIPLSSLYSSCKLNCRRINGFFSDLLFKSSIISMHANNAFLKELSFRSYPADSVINGFVNYALFYCLQWIRYQIHGMWDVPCNKCCSCFSPIFLIGPISSPVRCMLWFFAFLV